MLKIGVKLSGWLSGGVKFMSYGGGLYWRRGGVAMRGG